jgi:hypothetical protein
LLFQDIIQTLNKFPKEKINNLEKLMLGEKIKEDSWELEIKLINILQ